jgi:hypothetical protein
MTQDVGNHQWTVLDNLVALQWDGASAARHQGQLLLELGPVYASWPQVEAVVMTDSQDSKVGANHSDRKPVGLDGIPSVYSSSAALATGRTGTDLIDQFFGRLLLHRLSPRT